MKSELLNYSIDIIQGEDDKGVKFTAFILLDSKNDSGVQIGGEQSIDLTKLNIIHKILGHTVTLDTINDVKEYVKEYYIPNLEKKKHLSSPLLETEIKQAPNSDPIKTKQKHFTVSSETTSDVQCYSDPIIAKPDYFEIEESSHPLIGDTSITTY